LVIRTRRGASRQRPSAEPVATDEEGSPSKPKCEERDQDSRPPAKAPVLAVVDCTNPNLDSTAKHLQCSLNYGPHFCTRHPDSTNAMHRVRDFGLMAGALA